MTNEELAKLLELQKIDVAILELKKEEALLPKELDQVRKTGEKHLAETDEMKKGHTKVKVERRQQENELKMLEDQIKTLQSQLNEVKTNKEYLALKDEIDNFRKKISSLEDTILNLMETDEKLAGKEKDLVLNTDEDKKKLAGKEMEISRKMEEIRKSLAVKSGEREAITKTISVKTLEIYEKIRKGKKDGVVLVEMKEEEKGDVCTGCYVYLPSYIVEKLKKSNSEFVQCENCKRILY